MRFAFSEEQRLFQSAVRQMLEKECTPAHVRTGRVPGLWRRLAGLGVAGLTAPKEHGGLGLDETDLVLVLEEAGRAALPEPLLETTAVCAPLLAEAGDEQWLAQIASGETTATISLAGAPFAAYADTAAVLLLQHEDEVHAVPREATTLVAQRSLDPLRPLFSVEWTPGASTRLAAGADAISRAFDRGACAHAAQLIGIAARSIEMAASYAKEREQFGKPIGEFQAVKHRLANAFVRVEFARPVVYRAALSIASEDADRSRDASMAKAIASEAATIACKAALQVHGAIGYTQEHDLHLWLRRGFALASAWGGAGWHRERVARAVLR